MIPLLSRGKHSIHLIPKESSFWWDFVVLTIQYINAQTNDRCTICSRRRGHKQVAECSEGLQFSDTRKQGSYYGNKNYEYVSFTTICPRPPCTLVGCKKGGSLNFRTPADWCSAVWYWWLKMMRVESLRVRRRRERWRKVWIWTGNSRLHRRCARRRMLRGRRDVQEAESPNQSILIYS